MSDLGDDKNVVEEIPQQDTPKTSSQLKLILQGSEGRRTTVLVKPTTKISKLLSALCREQSVNPREHRLVYHGKVLLESEPISSYNMADNDVIEVVASQTGGFLNTQAWPFEKRERESL